MKFEIDLNDILGDENGVETLQESVRRQIVYNLTTTIKQGIQKQINQEAARVINEEMQTALRSCMGALIDDIMTAEYTPVTTYGDPRPPTTFRSELIRSITANMVYKKTAFSNDANAFTKAVDGLVSEQLKAFQAAFDKQVAAPFTAAVMEYAQAALAKKLGIKP